MTDQLYSPGYGRKYPLFEDIDEAMGTLMSIHWMKTRELRRRRGLIFRGQCNSQWDMIPTLYRPPVTPEIIAKRNAYTESFVRDLVRNAGQLGLKNLHNDKLNAIAQHYGFYTSFLDFTWNVEVAAYFASEGWQTGKIGVIYMFSAKTYEEIREPHSGSLSKLPDSKFIDFEDVPRIKVQEGVFLDVDINKTKILMVNCIDRFYFYQHREKVYIGGYDISKDWISNEYIEYIKSFDPYYGQNLKKIKQTKRFDKQSVYPPIDPISQFAEDWKKNNTDPTKNGVEKDNKDKEEQSVKQ